YANIRVVTAIAFSLIFGVLAGNGATRPDPGGWQGTRWGMSDEEIMTAMKGDAKRITSEGWRIAGAKVGIDSWTIGSHPYHVNFISDDGGLRRVDIQPHSISGPGASRIHPPVFDELNRLLVDKFGQ